MNANANENMYAYFSPIFKNSLQILFIDFACIIIKT